MTWLRSEDNTDMCRYSRIEKTKLITFVPLEVGVSQGMLAYIQIHEAGVLSMRILTSNLRNELLLHNLIIHFKGLYTR